MLTEIGWLILKFCPGQKIFVRHEFLLVMGYQNIKTFFLLCLFTELGAVCLQFRENPKSTNRLKKIPKNTIPHHKKMIRDVLINSKKTVRS